MVQFGTIFAAPGSLVRNASADGDSPIDEARGLARVYGFTPDRSAPAAKVEALAKLPDDRVVLVTSDREGTPESMRVYLGVPGKMRELELILADRARDGGSLEVHTDAGSFFFPIGASANTPGAQFAPYTASGRGTPVGLQLAPSGATLAVVRQRLGLD